MKVARESTSRRQFPKLIVEGILQEFDALTLERSNGCSVPNRFVVYLHPQILKELRQVEETIKEDPLNALNKKLSTLNRRRLAGLLDPVLHDAVGDFQVEIKESTEKAPSQLKIIVKGAFQKYTGELPKGIAPALQGSPTRKVEPTVPSGATERRWRSHPAAPPPGQVYATLSYQEASVPRNFQICKQIITAGRDDTKTQVDLRLPRALTDISRKHFAIRHDPDSGRFYITDLGSKFGTWVAGRQLEAHKESLLSTTATITLADGALILKFKAAR